MGEFFKMECPVTYCAQRPNVTWCKYSGKNCLPLETEPRQHTDWEDKDQVSVFTLHFEPVYPSDDGSYGCSIDFNSEVINSNIIALHVTGEYATPTPSIAFPSCYCERGNPNFQALWLKVGTLVSAPQSTSSSRL